MAKLKKPQLKGRILLTDDNYYTPEADRDYYSVSQYKDFLKCEAGAYAKTRGLYKPKPSDALIVGNYVHTALEGDEPHRKFVDDNIEHIFKFKKPTKKQETDPSTPEMTILPLWNNPEPTEPTLFDGMIYNGKKSDFVTADRMIDGILSDDVFRKLHEMDGQNEVIMVGTLFEAEYPFKIRLDKYFTDPARMILDWKTTADMFKTEYIPRLGTRASFLWVYDYVLRTAVYLEIEKQFTGNDNPAVFDLAVISKQDPSDKELINMNIPQLLEAELDEMAGNMAKIEEVKSGRRRPLRCGKCDYCRATKKITRRKSFTEFDPDVFVEREEDYAIGTMVDLTK